MDTNSVADLILAKLSTLHSRVYRNESIEAPTFPYVVFSLDSLTPMDPSTDYYLNVDVFEKPHTSVRAIETLADSIQNELDNLVLRTVDLNVNSVLEQRQFISQSDLTTGQMINLRFVLRSYFI